ncbi:MAG: hypothetical protein NXI31_23530 [bacterium]|nr:hypothetical protein [bacterium]
MHKVSLALAVAGTSLSLFAQTCNTSPPASSIRTYDPWAASFYYGNTANNTLNQFIDISCASPITITSMNVTTYDQGAGNPVVPDQTGNVAEVRIYLIPVTNVGNEGSIAGWGIDAAGNGTADGLPEVIAELTIVAWNGDSPIVNFKDPATGLPTSFDIPAGDFGMCIEAIPTSWTGTASLPQTQTIANPGALHTIGVSPNPNMTWSDQFITLSNDGIMTNGWQTVDATGTLVPNAAPTVKVDSSNIEINYTPDASAAVSVQYGLGCYDRPQATYDIVPENVLAGSAYEGTGQTWLANGSPQDSYIVVPGPGYQAPTSTTNLAAGAFTSSSSTSWDDANLTQALGFTFPFPGGSTTDITINSNGKIYLGLTTDASFAGCGSNYGSTATFRDGPPSGPLAQICVANTDLDLDQTVGGGALYFENPTPTSARITWEQVPNWPAVANEVMDLQITLYDSGQVDLAYGSNLYNSAIASGNSAIIGYSNGNGDKLGDPQNLAGVAGLQTGDGAFPPNLFVDGRPVAGTTVDIVGDNLSPGTAAGFVSIALQGLPEPGFDLTQFGLPGCTANLNIGTVVTSVFLFAANNELRWTWNVPTGFNGTQVQMQMGTITPGFNAAGILVTNAICAKIGT